MECFDEYDFERKRTGQVLDDRSDMPKGGYHLIAHLCIFNSAGEMLIQKRQSFKGKWPNMWDLSVGGKIQAGESSQEGIQRELKEELNLEIDFSGLRPHLTLSHENGYDDIFIVEKAVNLDELILQEDEVKAVKWASKETILDMIENNEFIDYYSNLVPLLFEMRKKYGYIYDNF